jgi:hypothetical protein
MIKWCWIVSLLLASAASTPVQYSAQVDADQQVYQGGFSGEQLV